MTDTINNPLISVIIPIYNSESFLKQTIQSVLNQTYKKLEIILVDDGSKDQSGKICDDYKKRDARIRVIHQKNRGVSEARMTGFQIASGDWISFIDNDDIIAPFMYQLLVKYVTVPEVEIISGNRKDMKIDEIESYHWKECQTKYVIMDGKEVCKRYDEIAKFGVTGPLWGKLIHRSLLERLNLKQYQKKCPILYFEDVLLTPRMFFEAKKILGILEVVYLHREVPTSISRSGKLNNFYYEQIDAARYVLEFYRERNCVHMYRLQLFNYFRIILRIWYLIDDTELNIAEKQKYKRKIEYYYKMYSREFMYYAKCNLFVKCFVLFFACNKTIWKLLVSKFLF